MSIYQEISELRTSITVLKRDHNRNNHGQPYTPYIIALERQLDNLLATQEFDRLAKKADYGRDDERAAERRAEQRMEDYYGGFEG